MIVSVHFFVLAAGTVGNCAEADCKKREKSRKMKQHRRNVLL